MTKLFNENLGTASNSTQLAKLKRKFNSYHPSYVATSTMATRPEFKIWLEAIWKQYEPYADSNFPNEFKKQFNQRTWELHLGSTLINRGYVLGSHANAGPDIKIPYQNNNVWVEAIAVEKGDAQDKVPDIKYGKAMDVPEKEMLLRLTEPRNNLWSCSIYSSCLHKFYFHIRNNTAIHSLCHEKFCKTLLRGDRRRDGQPPCQRRINYFL